MRERVPSKPSKTKRKVTKRPRASTSSKMPKRDRMRVGAGGGRRARDREPGWALRELAATTDEWLALTPGEALYRARRLGLVGPLPTDPREAALVLGSRLADGAVTPPKEPGA